MHPRHLLPAVALVLVVGCAGTDPDDVAAPAPTAPPVSILPPVTSPLPSAAPSPEGTVVDVTFAGGEVTGVESRVDVEVGERVVLRFTSDVPEEIHVHGYDLYADLVPGQTAEIAFTADLPGSYEVELHDAGRPLFQLRVA